MLVFLRGTPIRRPENGANIWNLFWLPKTMIISLNK